MNILTLDEIDRELVSWTKQVGDLSTTLIDFDNHPGLQHVRRYPPAGVTAQRWAVVETTLGQLWDDLASVTSTLQSAQAVRERRSKLDDDDRADLTRLLESGGLADTRDRMRAACDGCDRIPRRGRRDQRQGRRRDRAVAQATRRRRRRHSERDCRPVDGLGD